MATTLPTRRLDIRQYYALYEQGVLTDERLELLAGEIHEAAPIGSPHSACVANLTRLFARHLSDRWIVRVQDVVELPPDSVPQPDLAVAGVRDDGYAAGHPNPPEIGLVVEVSYTTLAKDRGLKLRLYARAGIPEYWIVDLEAEEIVVHTEPSGESYTRIERRRRGERIAPRLEPELVLEVAEILPWRAPPKTPRGE